MSEVVEKSQMRFVGIEYEVDLLAIRLAMARAQVRGGVPGYKGWAPIMHRHRQTIWRLLSGRRIALDSLSLIIKPLGLKFEDVARPVQKGHQAAA